MITASYHTNTELNNSKNPATLQLVMEFATTGHTAVGQRLLGGARQISRPPTTKNSIKSGILMSDTAQSDAPKPCLAQPCNTDIEGSYRSLHFSTELIDISTHMAVKNDDPSYQIIQDFDDKIVKIALNEFAYDVDNVHPYLNDVLADRTIFDTVIQNFGYMSVIIPNNLNTLNAATITVADPNNMSDSHYVTSQHLGHMVDHGAPYSAIGSTELNYLDVLKQLIRYQSR